MRLHPRPIMELMSFPSLADSVGLRAFLKSYTNFYRRCNLIILWTKAFKYTAEWGSENFSLYRRLFSRQLPSFNTTICWRACSHGRVRLCGPPKLKNGARSNRKWVSSSVMTDEEPIGWIYGIYWNVSSNSVQSRTESRLKSSLVQTQKWQIG